MMDFLAQRTSAFQTILEVTTDDSGVEHQLPFAKASSVLYRLSALLPAIISSGYSIRSIWSGTSQRIRSRRRTAGREPHHFGANSPYQYAAVTPPSMRTSLPVMNPPSAPMSSAPTFPTSSGVPARPAAETSIMRR